MKNTNKEQKIWMIVTIATVTILIFIFGGITYAFFTSNDNTGSTAEITNTSGKMTITYADGGNNLLVSSNISPSNNIIANKTFTLTGVNTSTAGDGLSMPYKVGIKYTSSFSDGQIHYYIKEVNRANTSNVTVNYTGEANQTVQGNSTYTGYSHGTLKNGNRYTELVTGEFPASTNNQTITFNLLMQFPDTGENQDSEKSKSINAYIEINHELNASEYIATLDMETNGLEIDDTEDKNLRYVGSNPNNYVEFGNSGELWRIIGVFDVKGKDDNFSQSIKLIRHNLLGKYSWDTSEATPAGKANWLTSKLMQELNGDYLNANLTENKTNWYNSYYDTTIKDIVFRQTGVFDYKKTIKQNYQNMINEVVWKLPAINNLEQSPLDIYNDEQKSSLLSDWTGKIGLIYASDYGYSSIDEECKKSIRSLTCKENNWLFKEYYWTLTVKTTLTNGIYVSKNGYITTDNTYNPVDIYPVLYLKSDIKIIAGTGTSTDPYIID